MKCTNPKCGKNMQPLELHNGEFACPHCRTKQTAERLIYTAENQELYILSESYFFRYLKEHTRETPCENLLVNAVELCKQADRLGNPHAKVRMGYYYDKDFVATNISERMRCQIAYKYYSSVCFSDLRDQPIGEGQTVEYIPDTWKELKVRSAKLMLEMLVNASDEFTNEKTYNLERNVRQVREKVGGEWTHYERIKSTSASRAQNAVDTFKACFSNYRAPRFGVLFMSADDIRKTFEIMEEKSNTGLSLFRMLEKGLELTAFACNADKSIDLGHFPKKFPYRQKLKQLLPDLTGNYWLYFFNTEGKQRFFGKGNGIKKQLEDRKFAKIKQIVNDCGNRDYIFFDDDLYLYQRKKIGSTDWNKTLNRFVDGLNESSGE